MTRLLAEVVRASARPARYTRKAGPTMGVSPGPGPGVTKRRLLAPAWPVRGSWAGLTGPYGSLNVRYGTVLLLPDDGGDVLGLDAVEW